MSKKENILKKIRESGVKQRSKWYFQSRRMMLWACFILCIIIGGVSFSIILFAFQQTDDNLLSHITHSRLELFLSILPFIWVLFLLIFLFASVFIARKSSTGYKYEYPILWGFSTLSSLIIGSLFLLLGGSEQLEKVFAERVANYQKIEEMKRQKLVNTEIEYLAGKLQKNSSGAWEVIDLDGNVWEIIIKDAFISKKVSLESGFQIKLKGIISSPKHITVSELKPLFGRHIK